MASTSARPLEVLIVGGGIGGLMAAVAFRAQGHHVTVFERSKLARETGAAVHIAPNAHGLLRRYDIKPQEFGANPVNGVAEYNEDGSVRMEVDAKKSSGMFPHLWVLSHRVVLHEHLKAKATDPSGANKPAVLKTSSQVVELDVNNATVTLADGSKVSGDLIVGADGVSSVTRKYVAGDLKPFSSGKSAFRFMIPHETIRAYAETRRYTEKDGIMHIWFANDRRLIMYPCNDNTVMNFVAIHPSAESAARGDSWSEGGSKETLLAVYKSFPADTRSLFEMADPATLKVWSLLDMDRITSWTVGRLALLGDAAHPFLPHQGQGAGVALEDAVSLALMFPNGTSPDEIPERFALYQEIRDERAHRIQEYSRLAGADLDDKETKAFNMFDYMVYNFGHDEWQNSTDKLHEWTAKKQA